MRRLISSLLLVFLLAVPGRAIEFSLPVEGVYGRDCFIQNYVDTDPSKGAMDYNCGSLTYDGHRGTDFRVPWAVYEQGVPVVAAADGVIYRTRDGVEDRDARGREDEVRKIGLGNAVVIRHEDGYQTTYGHMKKGSVRVREGQHVKRGQVLGEIGLSGLTHFSHLHFGVRHEDRVVCPFKGAVYASPRCGPGPTSLWADELPYISTGLLQAGFVGSIPSLPDIVREQPKAFLSPKTPVLLFAVTFFGVQTGDRATLKITAPSGEEFIRSNVDIDRNQAQRLMFTGRKLADRPRWPAGTYVGECKLVRNGEVVLSVERQVVIQ